MKRNARQIFALSFLAVGILITLGMGSAIAAPVLGVSATHDPTTGIAADGEAIYEVTVSNTGSTATSTGEPVTVDFTLPAEADLQVVSATDDIQKSFGIQTWSCAVAGDSQSATCTGPEFFGEPLSMAPGSDACASELGVACHILIAVAGDSDLQRGSTSPTVEACGGGAVGCATETDPTDTWLSFDVVEFDAEIMDQAESPYTEAGGHPFQITTPIQFTATNDGVGVLPTGGVRDIAVKLPPGLVGDPSVIPRCTEFELTAKPPACPSDSQVGVVYVSVDGPGWAQTQRLPVYNMVPPVGSPGEFGFTLEGITVGHIVPTVRSDGDYGITMSTNNLISEALAVFGTKVTFWGVPADPAHDSLREGAGCLGGGCASGQPEKAFISLPTSCTGASPITTTLRTDTWQDPGNFVEKEAQQAGIDGCNAVDFSPTLEARPTTNAADSPSGLDVDVHTPQNADSEGTAEAHLKDTTVTLPEGLVINPASANGLEGCSPSQIDLQGGQPDNCPDASKVGTVAIETPLIDHPLSGAVYVATPHDNPFDSLIAIYITVDDRQSGVVVKLAGEVELNQQTGRLTATVKDAPQLPFEHFHLHFKSGAGAPLRTPIACGTYQTTSSLTPWSAPESGPPATPLDSWAVSQGANGGGCVGSEAEQPSSPDLDAGTVSPVAGSYSPFVLNLSRADGTQQFSAVTLSPPPGLIGKLAGIGQCSDAALAAAETKSGRQEQNSPSCPAASAIGITSAGAGAGPAPYYAKGTAYLAGPYKGAPLSMAIVTPAVAGPFDLGTIVVRVALRVDRNSARITAVSDPIPTMRQGIPLDVKTVQVRLDRERFIRNGTSCDPLEVGGSLTSTLGVVTSLSERFQLGECSALAFKPKLGIRLIGAVKRGGHPGLRATLRMPEGGANIGKAVVALPHSEFLDQGHIGTVCTRVQFAAKQCPAASVYGNAVVTSPLLDYQVEGLVYLRSSDNELPDLVMALHGPPSQPIEVDAVGRIDSVKGGIRSTFEGVPDIPISSLTLNMAGGKKGLLENSENICKGKHKATAEFDGQNGKVSDFKVLLKNGKCGKSGKAKKRAAARRAAHRRAAR